MQHVLSRIEAIREVGAADRLAALGQFKALAAEVENDPLAYAVAACAVAEGVLRTAESQTAEDWLTRATTGLPAEPPALVLAFVRRTQAMVSVGLGRNDAALQFATEACGHADRSGDSYLQARCSHGLGMVLSTSGLLEEALDASFDARRHYIASGRPPPGGVENNIAILLGDLDYLDRSWEYADKCVVLAAQEGKRAEQASALVTRGWAAYRSGKLEESVADYLLGLEVARSNGNIQTLQILNINLGVSYIALGWMDEAADAFAQVEALLPERPSRWLEAIIKMETAALMDDEAAAAALAHARDELTTIGRAKEAADAVQKLYELAKQRGLWKEALEHHEDWTRRERELAEGRRRRRSRATELRIEKELRGTIDSDEPEELHEVLRTLEATSEDLRVRNRELELLAKRDELTGLLNRRGFDQRLEAELARRQGALSLAVIDVDRFKDVNDTYGHAVGDAVLVRVAALLQEGRRVADLVARRGGDEFVLLLPGANAQAARSVAGRVVDRVRREPWGEVVEGLEVTLSVGVAAAEPDQTGAELFAAADGALYSTKEGGRDGVS